MTEKRKVPRLALLCCAWSRSLGMTYEEGAIPGLKSGASTNPSEAVRYPTQASSGLEWGTTGS